MVKDIIMKLSILHEAFQTSTNHEHFLQHTDYNNRIIHKIHSLARTNHYDLDEAKDLLLDFITIVDKIPYGPLDYITKEEEDRIRSRIIEAARSTYSNPTQDNLLKFDLMLLKFWMRMTS